MPHRPSPPARHAFTLIELLVVISIIALLIGILLPALGAARGAARNSVCQSQMRQWGIAMSIYLNDHDDYLPREVNNIGNPALDTYEGHWYNALPKLVGEKSYSDPDVWTGAPGTSDLEEEFLDKNIWFCPSAGHEKPNPFGYGMNVVMNGSSSNTPNWQNSNQPHTRVTAIPNWSHALFLGEPEVDRDVIAGVSVDSSGAPLDDDSHGDFRHQGEASNFLFIDAHVSTFKVVDANTRAFSVGGFETKDAAHQTADGQIVWGVFTSWKKNQFGSY